MKKYKAIIYDIDGTVLNTLNMNMYPLMKIIKEELGEDWSFEDVLKFASYPGMKVMEELHIQDKEKTYERWVKYVNEYEEGASLYDGFEEVFKQFEKAGIIQAVVSAKTKEQYQINYPTVVAAINFDRTGTTRIGKYVLNHSFMLPGLVSTGVAIGLGLLFIRIF